MDYKEKYIAALERAKKLQETCDSQAVVGWCEYIFPELKESEDELIRKAIKSGIRHLETQLGYDAVDGVDILDIYSWLEKQGNKSVNIDIESMISSYKQRLKSQGGIENSPLLNMCLTAFRHGIENVLEELNLKKLDPDKVIEWIDEHVPTKFEDMANYVQQFKKDFGLC